MDPVAVKHLLMIAYHFPPLRGSSGIQRTLKFSSYLPQFGWQPIVLTPHARAYEKTGMDQMSEVAQGMPVWPAFPLDTARHLSIRGRYPHMLALPDRWASWLLGAVPVGLRMIRKYRPEVIWSTYPIATAHLIGLMLHRITGIPWLADFRDPMTDSGYPPDPARRRVYTWIERHAVNESAHAVVTTPGTMRMYRERFPDLPASRFSIIENGFDEENFEQAGARSTGPISQDRPLVLVHSGTLYPSERDPRAFFAALSALLRSGRISAASLRVVLRATYHDAYIQPLIDQHGIGEVVHLAPPIGYQEALEEMLAADGLIVFQATNCNHQIPAKLYEYLRARRPILGLTDPLGDTAGVLRSAGIDTIAALDSEASIRERLIDFLQRLRGGSAPVASWDQVQLFSRRARTQQLTNLLDQMSGPATG